MTTATSRPEAVDGRTARRLENRERVLDAALELVAEGADLDVDAIAQRSGISVRSVYNYFPTARHLVAACTSEAASASVPSSSNSPHRTCPSTNA
jgi:AcrR family transcriptional regulator